MNGFVVEPVFTAAQGIAFAALLTVAVLSQTVFSPRRRAVMGGFKFALANAIVAAPALAGVTIARGASRLGYLEEGRA